MTTKDWEKEFDELWNITNDILNDEMVGCHGKNDMVRKEIKSFISQILIAQKEELISKETQKNIK